MANHVLKGPGTVHHHSIADILVIPILTSSVALWPVWPWFDAIWAHAPTPTAIYMGISAAFMLFQMCDKLGLLERLKRKPPA